MTDFLSQTSTSNGAAPVRGAVSQQLVDMIIEGVAGSGPAVVSTAPFTGEPLARLPQCTVDDVDAAFQRARQAQKEWAAWPAKKRSKVFFTLYDMIVERQDEILDIIQLETGKSRLHAFEELLDGAGSTLYYARHAPKLLSTKRRAGALPIFTQARESYQPKGVVCTITPWNYPLALGLDVVPAMLAGNAVVHKPDNETALSSLWPRMQAIEAGLPAEVWQVVLGDPSEIGDSLIDNADFVGFTGSTPAGKAIAQRAAATLTGCSLELGGKNPMLVLRDADIKRTVDAAIRGCFANAGQLCVSIERIYVDETIYDRFVTELGQKVRDIELSSSMEFTGAIGSLSSQNQLNRVRERVEQAVAAGAKVVAGGRARPDLGPFFFEPTVLVDVPPSARVYAEETFGPVVTVAPFSSEEEAVRLANDTSYGLNAAVFSKRVRRARGIASNIKAGTVNINEGYASAYASQDAPMGGMKQSGLGRRHGSSGLLKYTDQQNVASQHVVGFDPAYGLSPKQHAAFLTRCMKLMKAARIR